VESRQLPLILLLKNSLRIFLLFIVLVCLCVVGTVSYANVITKVGLLRSKGKPEAGRDYFILFGNTGGVVKKGNMVTVVIGDFKVENLVVE
jgi:hypothetical protein